MSMPMPVERKDLRGLLRIMQEGKEVGDFNLQAWVPFRKVASIARLLSSEGNTIYKSSEIVTLIVKGLYEESESKGLAFPSSEEALAWAVETGLVSTKQIMGRGRRKYAQSLQLERISEEKGQEAEIDPQAFEAEERAKREEEVRLFQSMISGRNTLP